MNSSHSEVGTSPESSQNGRFRRIVDRAVLGFFGAMTAVNAVLVGVGLEIEVNEYADTQSLPAVEDIETIGMAAGATLVFAGLSVLQYRNMQSRRQNLAE